MRTAERVSLADKRARKKEKKKKKKRKKKRERERESVCMRGRVNERTQSCRAANFTPLEQTIAKHNTPPLPRLLIGDVLVV